MMGTPVRRNKKNKRKRQEIGVALLLNIAISLKINLLTHN
jgi:hypothetical protein